MPAGFNVRLMVFLKIQIEPGILDTLMLKGRSYCHLPPPPPPPPILAWVLKWKGPVLYLGGIEPGAQELQWLG